MGIDVAVGVGDDSGTSVGAGLGAVVALEGDSVTRVSLTSVPAQPNATRAPAATKPMSKAERNRGIDKFYWPSIAGDNRGIMNHAIVSDGVK